MGNSVGGGMGTVPSGYLLTNSAREAQTRFTALSALYDQSTIRHLEGRGITRGWHCLEIGAGNGTIARWLADRVGCAGHVLATDLDTRHLEHLEGPGLEIRRHDIGADNLPEATFDLIHTRLVLMHVPAREIALSRMISGLKPGGWLVMEEYDSCSMLPDPEVSPDEVFLPTHAAMMRLLEERGVNRRYGRLLAGLLRRRGLNSVGAEAQLFMWQQESPGIPMMQANFEQLREAMIDGNYVTKQQFDEDFARLHDPCFMTPSAILWSVWARRP
jgi:ubiquinone/menaquinone biosynthesis C-methylase UbiE